LDEAEFTMRRAIIVSAVIGFIAGGTAIYGLLNAGSTAVFGLLDANAPSPTSELTSTLATSNSDRVGLFDASDEAPRVRIGDLIILAPTDPDIATGSITPTAKPGQAAKKAKPRKQAQTPKPAPATNAAVGKPAVQQQASVPSEADSKMMALSGAE
jgi:hypothetical protein